MIRCQNEVTELTNDHKAIESTARPFVALRRLTFGELLARDEARWLGVSTPAELRCLGERVQREIEPGGLQRFADWMAVQLGHAFVRSAGLPVGRPRLELAS